MASLAERQSLAASLFAEKRYEEAERLLLELADERSAYSFLTSGYMSEMATIRPKNVKVAKYYYEQAGLEGEPEGYVRLGCLWSDEGEPASARTAFDKAERLLREQPDEGSIYASLTLGLKYQNGTNRPKDVEAAKGFYERAVWQGDPEACQRLGRLFSMKATGIVRRLCSRRAPALAMSATCIGSEGRSRKAERGGRVTIGRLHGSNAPPQEGIYMPSAS